MPFTAVSDYLSVPAGQYDTEFSEALGRDVPVPGTYHEVDPSPQGPWDVLIAPVAGFFWGMALLGERHGPMIW